MKHKTTESKRDADTKKIKKLRENADTLALKKRENVEYEKKLKLDKL
jgi:hypothetical protein